jgi:hypothetical protein
MQKGYYCSHAGIEVRKMVNQLRQSKVSLYVDKRTSIPQRA